MRILVPVLLAGLLGLAACDSSEPGPAPDSSDNAVSECCKKADALKAEVPGCCKQRLTVAAKELTGCCKVGAEDPSKKGACCKKTDELLAKMPECCRKAASGEGETPECCKKAAK